MRFQSYPQSIGNIDLSKNPALNRIVTGFAKERGLGDIEGPRERVSRRTRVTLFGIRTEGRVINPNSRFDTYMEPIVDLEGPAGLPSSVIKAFNEILHSQGIDFDPLDIRLDAEWWDAHTIDQDSGEGWHTRPFLAQVLLGQNPPVDLQCLRGDIEVPTISSLKLEADAEGLDLASADLESDLERNPNIDLVTIPPGMVMLFSKQDIYRYRGPARMPGWQIFIRAMKRN